MGMQRKTSLDNLRPGSIRLIGEVQIQLLPNHPGNKKNLLLEEKGSNAGQAKTNVTECHRPSLWASVLEMLYTMSSS